MIFSPIKRCVFTTLTMSDSEECSCLQEYIHTAEGTRLSISELVTNLPRLKKYDRHDQHVRKELRKTSAVCYQAAREGRIHVLRYAREGLLSDTKGESMYFNPLEWVNLPWCKCACEAAVRRAHLKCLVYLREGPSNTLTHSNDAVRIWEPCPWDEKTCSEASSKGRIWCLVYAREGIVPRMDTLPKNTSTRDSNGMLLKEWVPCSWDEKTCSAAAAAGSLRCLQYARGETHYGNGNREPCPWNEKTCIQAVINDRQDVLEYAHRAGCQWSVRTTYTAALMGRLECLKYAHENGCEWDETTTTVARMENEEECYNYALENGCPNEEGRKSYSRRVIFFNQGEVISPVEFMRTLDRDRLEKLSFHIISKQYPNIISVKVEDQYLEICAPTEVYFAQVKEMTKIILTSAYGKEWTTKYRIIEKYLVDKTENTVSHVIPCVKVVEIEEHLSSDRPE
jgi:hypothetical protein